VKIAMGVIVVLLVVALLAPVAINQISSTDTATWDADVVTFWNILPLLGILGIGLFFIYKAVRGFGEKD